MKRNLSLSGSYPSTHRSVLQYMEILQFHASFNARSAPLELKTHLCTPFKTNFMYIFHNLHSCVHSHILYPCVCVHEYWQQGICRISICSMHINVASSIQCRRSSYFFQQSASRWHVTEKIPSNVNSAPFRPGTPHSIYVNQMIFFQTCFQCFCNDKHTVGNISQEYPRICVVPETPHPAFFSSSFKCHSCLAAIVTLDSSRMHPNAQQATQNRHTYKLGEFNSQIIHSKNDIVLQ